MQAPSVQNVNRSGKVFMSEHSLPGMTARTLEAVERGLLEAGRRLTAAGQPVQYVRGIYVPGQGRWICLFAAAEEDAVHRAIDLAQIPRTDVHEVVDPRPPHLGA